jgi:hypothetical protein
MTIFFLLYIAQLDFWRRVGVWGEPSNKQGGEALQWIEIGLVGAQSYRDGDLQHGVVRVC